MTAELALGLPLLLAITLVMAWLLAAGAAQVRAVDAARETARALARGDDRAGALALGRRVAPHDARIAVRSGGGRLVVRVRAPVPGPGVLPWSLPALDVAAEAVALEEDTGADAGR